MEPFEEICRTSIFLNRIEETSIKWCSSHLAVRTDKGIHTYGFSKNPKCSYKTIDFIESFIKTPTSSPCSKLLLNGLNKSQLKNKELAELIMDTAFWPHSDLLAKELNTIVSFEWSPTNVLPNGECILAVVNNTGSVNLYVNERHEWKSVLDLCSLVHEQFSEVSHLNPNSFEEVKRAVFNLESSSVCWSPDFKDGTCYLVTGQKSGTFLFWRIKCSNEKITAQYCGKHDTTFDEVVTLLWIPKSDTHFTLIATNLQGQISAYDCQIKNEIAVNKSHLLWEHLDKMPVDHVQWESIENQLLLIFHKHRHFVMQVFDTNFKIVSQAINNINDYRITSIVKGDGYFYTSTVNSKLYKLKYLIENNVLKVDFDLINLGNITETSEVYGIGFSENKAICSIPVIDRKVSHKKEKLKIEILFLNVLQNYADIDMLIANPSKQLTGYWDCIQLLRIKIMKAKKLPPLDYVDLLSIGNEDMYELKIYLIILHIYKYLVATARIPRLSLPEESIETLNDKILLAQAKKNVVKVYTDHCSNQPLSDLDKECFMASKMFVEFYCKKYKIPLNDIISPDISQLNFKEICYTCQNCDEVIEDFSCNNGHLNMFCMLTFTLIESEDYLSCKNCDTIARVELKNDKTLCIFCDSYISDTHLPV